MNNEDIENVNDRELFSELFDNPIHPLLIQMVPPFVDKKDLMFHLQMILHGPTLSRIHAQDVHSKLKGCVYLPAFTTQSSSRARAKKIDRISICVKTVAFTKVL